ncbi:MAG TPA: tetratricopeptide repeat protein, partial [Pararhizobium sp.]|nr:tetratricopeptide repeat protein [Pararhizobium sp.]
MKQDSASRMAQHENFFREVSEDLRNERFKQLWERFGLHLIALVVILVLAVAGYVAYGYWSGQKAAQSGDQFLAALKLADANKPDQALKALDALQKSGHGDYP